VILLAVLTVAIAVIRMDIGHAYTEHPLLAIIFMNPDGSPCQHPCLFGLKPGHMTYEQELATLGHSSIPQYMARSEKSQPDMHLYADNDFTVSVCSQEVWLGIGVANFRPNAPTLAPNFTWPPLTLGEAIAEFGPPDYIARSRITAAVYYSEQHLVFSTLNRQSWAFGPDDIVFGIGRVSDGDQFQRTSNMLPWKGFDVDGTRYNRSDP
jgi:hypothetical protein